ncbi:MAG: hypothetical protein CMH64_04590 [Nanoarchaeota archaeon]|nr:hypothetical protein [Nanoarchaeota archaeon]|tara:strand:+ start:1256 stop:1513 length:258 start_codon:yes stop_codon:yes gene_type:complete
MVSIAEMADYVFSLYHPNGKKGEDVLTTLRSYKGQIQEDNIKAGIEKLEKIVKGGILDPTNQEFHTSVMVLYSQLSKLDLDKNGS